MGRIPEPDRGRCRTCGFLAIHRDEWAEAPERVRASGHFYKSDNELNTHAACFRAAADLLKEFEVESKARAFSDAEANSAEFEANKAIINRNRDCPAWFPWMPGFSPQQHSLQADAMHLGTQQGRKDTEVLNWTRWGVVLVAITLFIIVLLGLFPEQFKNVGSHLAAWFNQLLAAPSAPTNPASSTR